LLEHGANVNCGHDFKSIPTCIAATNARFDIFKQLCDARADLALKSSGQSPYRMLFNSALAGGSVEIVGAVLDAARDVVTCKLRLGDYNSYALENAAGNGNTPLVELLIERMAALEGPAHDGYSLEDALCRAV